MTFIELKGHVNENGELEFPKPTNLPPGDVRIIIETFDAGAEAADEALWDAQFAGSQDVLERLSQEAHEDYLAGRTEACDGPDAV
jgi:hypothetical protein